MGNSLAKVGHDSVSVAPTWWEANAGAFVVALIVSVLIPWLTVFFTRNAERRHEERRERIAVSLELMHALDKNFLAAEAPQHPGEKRRVVFNNEINTAVARILILTTRNRDVGNEALQKLRNVSNRDLAAGILGHWINKGRFRSSDRPESSIIGAPDDDRDLNS